MQGAEDMKLRDKVAIITGSSRGIGKAMALDFAREGTAVVVSARTEAAGKLPGTIHDTVREIEQAGGKALAVKCDVSEEAEVNTLVGQTLERFGRIDVLVNNAAVGYYRTVMETPVRHWDLVMKVNVRGAFLCIKAVLPAMTAQKRGSIINISSSSAEHLYSMIGRPDGRKRFSGCAYGVSKLALERLARGLAEEVKGNNIAVNALKPARPTLSPGVAFWNQDVDESAFVSPHLYMTKAAIFLAAQDASGVTGGVFYDKDLCEKYGL